MFHGRHGRSCGRGGERQAEQGDEGDPEWPEARDAARWRPRWRARADQIGDVEARRITGLVRHCLDFAQHRATHQPV
jgi:hypothetical protein